MAPAMVEHRQAETTCDEACLVKPTSKGVCYGNGKAFDSKYSVAQGILPGKIYIDLERPEDTMRTKTTMKDCLHNEQ